MPRPKPAGFREGPREVVPHQGIVDPMGLLRPVERAVESRTFRRTMWPDGRVVEEDIHQRGWQTGLALVPGQPRPFGGLGLGTGGHPYKAFSFPERIKQGRRSPV